MERLDRGDFSSIDEDAAGASAPPRRPALSDIGNSERLVWRARDCIRHCWDNGCWYVWDGKRFSIDRGAGMQRLAKETATSIFAEAAACESPDEQRRIAQWASQSGRAPRVAAMVDLARSHPDVVVSLSDLDADLWLLNVENGILDLRTGRLSRHAKARLCTRLAPVPYQPDAQCPRFVAFLNRILQNDQDLIAFMQRALGYSLTGDTKEQCLFLPVGRGANGKSTLISTIAGILGDYAASLPADSLLSKSYTNGAAATPDLVRLPGARFVTASESEGDRRLAEGLVKAMTGGEDMLARRLHGEFFSFPPEFKVWLSTNHKPVIKGSDHGIWRRIRLLPFDIQIPEAERDKTIGDQLKAEAPGILAWLVEGCRNWQQDGLGAADSVTRATNAYRAEMDKVGGFLFDCCRDEPHLSTASSVLYAAYVQWARANGEQPISSIAFSTALEEKGYVKKATKTTKNWLGISIVSPALDGRWLN